MRPHVLLDCDGVLALFNEAACAIAEKYFSLRFDPATITTWDTFASFEMPNEDKRKAVEEYVYGVMQREGGCFMIPVAPGAKEGVAKLRTIADITIVTSPFTKGRTWMHEREQWLATHFDIKHDDIIHARKKWLVHGDFLVDDKPSHVERWFEYWNARGPEVQGVLWATPGNASALGLKRARSWDELYNLVLTSRG